MLQNLESTRIPLFYLHPKFQMCTQWTGEAYAYS